MLQMSLGILQVLYTFLQKRSAACYLHMHIDPSVHFLKNVVWL